MESMEERVHVYPQLNGKPSPKQGDGSHTYSRGGWLFFWVMRRTRENVGQRECCALLKAREEL